MALIVPTITATDPTEVVGAFGKFQSFAKRIQLDMSDGTFAPTTLAPLNQIRAPEGVAVDVHLMTAKPSQQLAAVVALKPSLCIVHAEVDDDLPTLAQQLRAAGIKFGVALLKGTFPGRVKSILEGADHVMVFAGNLGEQGGTIDMMQIEKIPLIRAIKPDAEIGWDGGANLSNVRALAHAGVDVINVGSALTRATDAGAMYQSLLAEIEKKGVLV